MADDALQTVRLRNNFYRDSYRRVVVAMVFMVAVIFVLSSVVYYQVTQPKLVREYFATTQDGRIIPIIPLSDPHVSTNSLLQFSAEAAMSAYSFDFINYRKQLQDAEPYFTKKGWEGFMKGLETNLRAVIKKHLVVHAVPGGAPVIVRQGMIGERWAWKIQMPLVVTYSSGSDTFNNSLMVTMVVKRVSTLDKPRGIAVDQINYVMARR